MKRKYLLTTDNSPDGVIYTYNEAGLMEAIEIAQQNMNEAARINVFSTLSLKETGFLTWAKSIRCTLVQLDTKISFEMFWDKYDYKGPTSKKRTNAVWDKMKEAEQVKAFMYIDRYFKMLTGGIAKKYPDTYLNEQIWNN